MRRNPPPPEADTAAGEEHCYHAEHDLPCPPDPWPEVLPIEMDDDPLLGCSEAPPF